ncbi:7843_t:CDS:2, partial [Gigaspora margarita]
MEGKYCIDYLNTWYNGLRSRYVDLTGDFGGSELFVVEDDSLLYEFLCDPERHFLNFKQSYGGGQFLSLTYLIETFLNKLKLRGCIFHLVFFHGHKVIWNFDPKFRIAREIIIDHLKSCQHESKIPVYEFPAWWDPQFDKYIDGRQPLFILSGDGTIENTKNPTILSKKKRIEFRNSRAQAFVFDRGGNVELSTIENVPNIVRLCSTEATESQALFCKSPFNEQESKKIFSNLFNKQKNQSIFKNGGKRLILIIISLIALFKIKSEPIYRIFSEIKSKPIYRIFSKIFLLHIYLLDYITLPSKTMSSIPEKKVSNVNKFLENFYNCCANILVNNSFSNLEDMKNNLADFVDTRIFISLIKLQKDECLDFNCLPKEIQREFDTAWNILECYDKNKIINFGDLLDNIQIQETNIPIYANKELSLLPFDYPFFVKILGDMQLELSENDNDDIVDSGSCGIAGDIPTKKLIEQANKDKLEKSLKDDEASFNIIIEETKKCSNLESKLSYLCDQIDKKDKFKHPKIKIRAQNYKLQLLFNQWNEYCINADSKKKDSNNYAIPVEIYRQIFFIAQNFSTFIDKDQKDYLLQILERLGLEDSKNRLLTMFQILYAGHLIDRNTNSVDDKRVKNFKPDQWQCEVLDVIGNNESALVCCPTSSGKTFISFYAIEKILREDDEAEVYGRFEKNYTHGGKTVWGIRTREYNENHDKCQILVTVPEMLEILLLSPSNVKWVSRIRRIILDEVHCIGEMDGGSTWETLLLLAQCPILALSATIRTIW